ncbi:MAG: hypothetical protein J5633_09795 [Oscillospiraceae bacterium]|nr:hypothetical protein [Oscillospiraceae bacterium]
MTLQAIFEQNRERLISAVSGADAATAIPVLNAELDRILYTFNDQEENARVREAAGSMIQVAKAACSLVDTAGDTKIYGRTDYGAAAPVKGRLPKWGLVLLILGVIGAAVTTVGIQLIASAAAAAAADWQSSGLPPRWLLAALPLLTVLLFFLAGMLLRRGKTAPRETLHAETKLDASLVCNRLLSVILVMDKRLEEVRISARQEEKERQKEQASAMDPEELELLSRLLEDAYGRRGEDGQAEEEISQIRFYLHRKNIDVVDWTPEGNGPGGWFDMMPAFSGGTIRPALAADGVLLKKGMASAGRG